MRMCEIMARDEREITPHESTDISMKSAGRYVAIHIWLWAGVLEIMGREKHELVEITPHEILADCMISAPGPNLQPSRKRGRRPWRARPWRARCLPAGARCVAVMLAHCCSLAWSAGRRLVNARRARGAAT